MNALYRWPTAAWVGRVVPKERLYAEASAGAGLKQRFVDEVQRIRWAFKLGEESVRLRGDEVVPEIQVFVIDLKSVALSDQVLTAIDRSIPSPIFFELQRSTGSREEVQLSGALKQPGARGPKLSAYFRGPWLPADSAREPLPAALNLPGLYSQLLASLIPAPAAPGEDLPHLIDRMALVRTLEREISALDKRVRTESQFNRKVELRRQLRGKQAELDALRKSQNKQNAEDATWRS